RLAQNRGRIDNNPVKRVGYQIVERVAQGKERGGELVVSHAAFAVDEVIALARNVAQFYNGVGKKIPLHIKIPLLDERVAVVDKPARSGSQSQVSRGAAGRSGCRPEGQIESVGKGIAYEIDRNSPIQRGDEIGGGGNPFSPHSSGVAGRLHD